MINPEEWVPGDPIYPRDVNFRVCADKNCGAGWAGSGQLPEYCAECGGEPIRPIDGDEAQRRWNELKAAGIW